ncbi:MAG: hydrogenase nickel incorporation protein HypB [Candidatus Margulisbacteria bacterium]|nr:hydrogenase nickel incorporation protein HypB [Candidatus Margulisiibacteriota bacterium]
MEIKVMKSVLEANEDRAQQIRELLKSKNIYMLNFIGSPGAGKTSLLEKTIESLKERFRIAVIEGDVATDKDAKRLQKYDLPIIMVNTDGGCHLDSMTIEKALEQLDLDNLDLIFIENVGNLVCPAEFDLGENAKIAILSTTEGDDKPAKYPFLFREASSVVLNKADLIEYTNFDRKLFIENVLTLNGQMPIFEVSCTKRNGLDDWYQWLEKELLKN